ncbi:hypothetical protein VKT23_007900 [Stygiomarasmius scandens]|uniref:F-box domain-containing protein n=1 Tax=Marasmiellus scandens TaxID=2682957 RepID=A0ABR1JIQ2_9AGAR
MDLLQQYLSTKRVQEPLIMPPQTLSVALETLRTEERCVEKLETQQAEITASLRLRQHRIATIRNLLTPIRRIPPEILTEIFLQYVQSENSLDWQPSEKQQRLGSLVYLPPAVVLSQVCWSWRRTAEMQPCLWAKLSFTIKKSPPDPELLGVWLHRSGTLPLDIEIRAFRYDYPKFSDDLLNTLLSFSARWRSLHFERFRISDIQRLLNQPHREVHVPLLEDVTFNCDYFPSGHSSLSVIEEAPQLITFRIDAEIDIVGPTETLKTTLITHLDLSGEAIPSDIFEFLKPCHLLQEFTLNILDLDDPVEIPSYDIIQFPHLRILCINFIQNFGCPQIFNGLKLPSLSELSIDHDLSYESLDKSELANRISPIPFLIGLHERSKFELLEFSLLNTATVSTMDLLDFLRRLPSLQILNLQDCHLDTGDFVKALRVSKSMATEDIYLPRLTKLCYIQDNIDEADPSCCCVTCMLPESLDPFEQTARMSHMVAGRYDPRVYSGDWCDWQDSWPVSRLQGGLVVSSAVLLDHYLDEDYVDDLWYDRLNEETNRLKGLQRQGMSLKIV